MHSDDTAARILDILSEVADGLDFTDLNPDEPLREQLGLDSVDFLDFLMVLRNRYGIEVPEEDYLELATLNGCVAYLGPRLAGAGAGGPPPEAPPEGGSDSRLSRA